MFAVDINLLKERPGLTRDEIPRGTVTGPVDRMPMLLGGLFALGSVGLVLLASAGLTFRNQQLVAQEQKLEGELSRFVPELKKLEAIRAEEQRVNSETQALTTIFNQIKPWSAMLQDVRDRVPPNLQINKLDQGAAAPPPAPAPAASPAPQGSSPSPSPAPATAAPPPAPVGTALTLTGKARSFADVNDFVLSLQNSAFIDRSSVKLVKADRAGGEAGAEALVDYQIQTAVTGVPASELLQQLREKGATGLTSRIDFLKQKGVIQK